MGQPLTLRPALGWVLYALLAIVVAGFAYYAAQDSHDFRVYYFAARDWMEGNPQLYGPHFGLDWPMLYRYPPWSVVLFLPFTLLPEKLAAGLWVALKFVVLYLVVRMIQWMVYAGSRGGGPLRCYWWLPVLIATPHLVREFRIGNVHFFVFAAMVAALYFLHRQRPVAGGALLAVAIGVKLIPAFFVPYLLVKRKVRMVAVVVALLAVLALLPAAYAGFEGNFELLKAWWKVNDFPAPTPHQWGAPPDHSLKGVLTRYLSTVPYASYRDTAYQNINVAEVSPQVLSIVWLVVVMTAYSTLLVLGTNQWRREERARAEGEQASAAPLEYSLLFCAMLLLAPLSQNFHFVALLFPAVVLGYELRRVPSASLGGRIVWGMAVAAAALQAVPPLIPGRANQRLVAVYSPIFLGTLLLAVCFVLLLRYRRSASEGAATPSAVV